MHAVEKNVYQFLEMQPFFLGQVFSRKLLPHRFPLASHLNLRLTRWPRKD